MQTSTSSFPEYHKINTLFERDERFVVNASKLRNTLWWTIREWDVTEKIDGMNIRVMLSDDGTVSFGGRTDAADLTPDIVSYLSKTFTADSMRAAFWIAGKPVSAVLYGEGYGGCIRKGKAYRPDASFILFDVLVNGRWWLERNSILDVAAKLNIDTVPYLGRMGLEQIVDAVRRSFPSRIGTCAAEGVVARPVETLFDRRGERIIIKLKTRDFVPGKR